MEIFSFCVFAVAHSFSWLVIVYFIYMHIFSLCFVVVFDIIYTFFCCFQRSLFECVSAHKFLMTVKNARSKNTHSTVLWIFFMSK